jgi:hypothetical protein
MQHMYSSSSCVVFMSHNIGWKNLSGKTEHISCRLPCSRKRHSYGELHTNIVLSYAWVSILRTVCAQTNTADIDIGSTYNTGLSGFKPLEVLVIR